MSSLALLRSGLRAGDGPPDLDQGYGGVESVLICPVYPIVGINNRGQWNLYRNLSADIAGLPNSVTDFHRRDVRVLFPAMPEMGTK